MLLDVCCSYLTPSYPKVSRMLSARAALATRCDASGEETNTDMGIKHRVKERGRVQRFV